MRRSSRTASRPRSPSGTTRGSRRKTPVSSCPAPRSPSPTARTRPAPPRTSPSSWSRARRASGSSAATRPSTGPPTARAAAATAGWRRSSRPPLGPLATIKNQAGNYVEPSVQSATEAASNASVKPDLTFSAIWASGTLSYPITAQSWVLVYQKQSSSNTAKMLKAYIGYLVGDGQKLLPQLGYAPLPSSIDQQAKAQISKV